ncbi:MAG: endonuclease V [Burkholderiaceae bacterium]|nr:endonuclease V [Burkholderiaceae bacterium]
MIACLDVFYRSAQASCACVLFSAWTDSLPAQEFVRVVSPIEPYEPGHFYRRELPCLLAILGDLSQLPTVIVIDAYVWLDSHAAPGLGARLYEALNQKIPVIGVAKSRFLGAPAIPITRGKSRSPLFVSAAGMESTLAAHYIEKMHGAFRIPTLIQRTDQLSRAGSV